MNMQKPNGLVDGQAGQKMGTNTLQNVDDVLADNVMNEHGLPVQGQPWWSSVLEGTQSQHFFAVLHETSLPMHWEHNSHAMQWPNGRYSSHITCL